MKGAYFGYSKVTRAREKYPKLPHLLTLHVSPPALRVWSSVICHPSWSPPTSPPGTAPLPSAHHAVCGQSASDQLARPSWSSTTTRPESDKLTMTY